MSKGAEWWKKKKGCFQILLSKVKLGKTNDIDKNFEKSMLKKFLGSPVFKCISSVPYSSAISDLNKNKIISKAKLWL